ncbi:MAG: amidohydrolase family protein, partial [Bacillota bacterium]
CPVATRPAQARSVNDFSIWINKETGIAALGSVHPGQNGWEDELRRIRDAGLAGIKLHPDYQHFFVDEPRMFPIYEACVKLGLVIVFHAGVDIGYPDPVHCPPHRFRRVAERVDTSRFVLGHMGGWSMWAEAEECLLGLNVYFDTAYCFKSMSDAQFLRMARAHGTGKILFASDSPWMDQQAYVEHLRALELDAHEYEAIAGGNAAKLFGITNDVR